MVIVHAFCQDLDFSYPRFSAQGLVLAVFTHPSSVKTKINGIELWFDTLFCLKDAFSHVCHSTEPILLKRKRLRYAVFVPSGLFEFFHTSEHCFEHLSKTCVGI